jgi:hypothetical protein
MSAALRFSRSRSEVRSAVMVQDELRLDRRFSAHNAVCCDGETCFKVVIHPPPKKEPVFQLLL